MKILVIGGAGFIGSHLCELYANNHEVTSLDNYISGKKDNHIAGVEYLEMNSKDILTLEGKYNLIFHFGEYSRVEQSLSKIDYVLSNNLSPILNILKFSKKCKAKLIYAGSSTKFSDAGENKFKSPYAFSKWQNSEIVKFYCENYNIEYAITYFYNVYGERENAHGEFATVIAKFLEKKRQGKTLEVTLPGSQERNFTYIKDTIAALDLIAKDGKGDEFGIGNNKSYSIVDVAKMISSDIKFIPENPANRNFSELITKKTIDLGWKAKFNLEDYLRKYI